MGDWTQKRGLGDKSVLDPVLCPWNSGSNKGNMIMIDYNKQGQTVHKTATERQKNTKRQRGVIRGEWCEQESRHC